MDLWKRGEKMKKLIIFSALILLITGCGNSKSDQYYIDKLIKEKNISSSANCNVTTYSSTEVKVTCSYTGCAYVRKYNMSNGTYYYKNECGRTFTADAVYKIE
jgi:hypothetical protein